MNKNYYLLVELEKHVSDLLYSHILWKEAVADYNYNCSNEVSSEVTIENSCYMYETYGDPHTWEDQHSFNFKAILTKPEYNSPKYFQSFILDIQVMADICNKRLGTRFDKIPTNIEDLELIQKYASKFAEIFSNLEE